MGGERTISLGMPVYNGEKYLAQSLESILCQSLKDFELIICDNGSSDNTGRICQRFANLDRRVKYHKRDFNVGAADNFNLAFRLARGKYFKWCAHDDVVGAGMLEACVTALEENPDAVLAYPDIRLIDADGRFVSAYEKRTDTGAVSVCARFSEMLAFGNKCYEVFGVIRSLDLEKTGLIGKYAHSDGVLLAELALRGRFIHVRAPLMSLRVHDTQSMTMVGDYRRYTIWFDPKRKMPFIYPYWRMHFEFWRALKRTKLKGREKAKCYGALGKVVWKRLGVLTRELLFPIKYYWRTVRKSVVG